MEKRLLLFLCLAFLVMFAWLHIFPPPKPPAGGNVKVENNGTGAVDVTVNGEKLLEPEEAAISPKAPPAIGDSEERELELLVGGAGTAGPSDRRGAYRVRFSNRGARLVSLDLADFVRTANLGEAQRLDSANWLRLVEPVETSAGPTGSLLLDTRQSSQELAPGGLAGVLWRMEELGADGPGVRFRYSPPGGAVVFEKTITFEPGTWHLRVVLTLQNVSAGSARSVGFAFTPTACTPAELGDRFYAEPTAVAIGRTAPGQPYQSAHKAAPGLKEPGTLDAPKPLTVAGVHNKYFAFLLREAEEGQGTLGGASYAPVLESSTPPRPLLRTDVTLNLALPAQGEKRSWEYVVYAGPKAPQAFVADCEAHQNVIDDDLSVDSVAKSLLYVLRLLEKVTGNWGLAIILLTLCVRAALFPLNRRSQTSMARYQKKMKRVQPRLDEVKKRFADDATKLREAQAKIMQEEGAFPPLGGCLPIFLQMPIFFGLFSALRTSFDLRQAPFYGWIHDLSRPDHLLPLRIDLPILPSIEYLNVLPILMVVLWVLQQLGMPKPADEQAARMQKMMAFMPIVFGVMLYNYAAGLSLYMITTSSCSIVEQRVIKKLWPIDDTEKEPKKRKGCGPFAGMFEHLAEKQREQMKRMQAMENERRRQKRKR